MSMRPSRTTSLGLVIALVILPVALVAGPDASAEQGSSRIGRIAAASLAVGSFHSCQILVGGSLRCWGDNTYGELGYGNTNTIGNDETPATVVPVNLGTGRTALAVTGGGAHTCAILDNSTVRCWGANSSGQLGYGNTDPIGNDESPASVGTVNLGSGRTALAIAAGDSHTCAILDNHRVRCWGNNGDGQLGYGNMTTIGNDETPAAAGPVDLGTGRTAVAISAGDNSTCAILDNATLRCWGDNANGELGYGNIDPIGDNETPGSAGPVNLGTGRTAIAVSVGLNHTCAVLDNRTVRCWGDNGDGQLGYGNLDDIGDTETPGTVGPVALGTGRTALAVTAGGAHTCAILDNGTVRCWGSGLSGRLGYGNTDPIGDTETPATVGPVALGTGRVAVAIDVGESHSCAVLDNRTLRCWGSAGGGNLGYANATDIGDNETPAAAGPVSLGGYARTYEQPRLALGATPHRDRTPKYKYTVTGTLTGRFIRDAGTCTGTATAVATTGKGSHKRVLKRTTATVRSNCTLSVRIAFGQRKLGTTKHRVPIKIKVSYLGNRSLRPAAAVITVRAR